MDYNDPRLHELVTERERTGKARGEVTGIKRTGECFACEYSSVTFKDLNGEKRCCTEIIDLSKWKQAEAKAHQSEENLRAIFNSTVDGFVLVNRDLQVMAYNDKARDFIFLNSDLQAVPIGSSIFEYVDKSRHAFFGEVTKRVLSGETIEYERSYERRTEEPQWFTFSLNPVNEAGKITGLCISARNITVQKRAEEGRINSEKRFRGLVEHNSDAIAILSVEGRVLYVSPAAEHINGFSEEEAREMDVFETIHEDDRPKAMQVMQKVMEQPGIPINAAPLRMRHKNGTWRWIEAVITNMLHDPAIGGIIDNFRDVTERMESEEKYRKIFNLSPLPKWIYDLDTLRILEVNEEAVRHYGYSHEEFLTMTILDVRPSEDSGFVKEVLKDLTNSGAKQFGYWRHLKKNGEIIMVDITGHPIEYNGRNARMVICRDVTVKLKAQTELIRSNERFHQAARATSDAIWDWDMITETVFLGEGYVTLFGYTEGGHNVPRSWIQERIHPDDRKHVKQKVDEVIIEKISDRWQDEYQFQKADGSWAIVCNRGVLITDENGKPLRMVGAMNDVTAQKAEEHHLRLLESVITNTTDAVMITAAKSAEQRNPEVIYTNPAMENMTGYTAAEIKTSGIYIINGPETSPAEMLKVAQAIDSGESCQILTVFYKKDQQPYWASLAISPVTDRHGEVKNYIAIARDVTERMEYLSAIEEQNKQLREIAWFQSHIVRAPLSRIMGLTDIATAECSDEGSKEVLGMLRQSADDLDAIVREIVQKTQIIYGDLADGDN